MNNLKTEQLVLRDAISILWRHKGAVMLFFATVVAVTAFISFKITPVYRATVKILVDMESPNVLTTSGAVSMENQDYFAYKEYNQSQRELITSLSIVKKVFNEFEIGKEKVYAEAKDPLAKFLKAIKVESVKDTRILKLQVDNKNAGLAAKIANRIAELYVKRNLFYISREEITNLLKNEYLKLESKMSEYSKVYKEKHPKMIRLKQEIAEMVEKINKIKKASTDSDVLTDFDLTQEEEYALEGFKANNISIQDMADAPKIPVRPKKLLNIVISVIVGILGGIGLAFFFDSMDDTIKTVDDIESVVNAIVLGSVPHIRKISGKLKEIQRDRLVHMKPKDPVSEVYRSIRTNVLFSSSVFAKVVKSANLYTRKEDTAIKSFVITSLGPREGKTTTFCNLGIALAQNDKKVLLVDADMRKPRLHDVFGMENTSGLSSFLNGEDKLDNIIKTTDIPNISVVLGGPLPNNPSELIFSQKMEQFIKQSKDKFDFILFDTPPTVVVTDANILGKLTDGLILVVESGKTRKNVIRRIFQGFNENKIQVIGVVLNKIPLDRSNPYYHYYSKYYGK